MPIRNYILEEEDHHIYAERYFVFGEDYNKAKNRLHSIELNQIELFAMLFSQMQYIYKMLQLDNDYKKDY